MLADYASRMRLRNDIIVGVLTGDRNYAASDYLDDARAMLSSLIAESLVAARRLASELDAVEDHPGNAGHVHDYHSADATNLKRREAVSRALAKRLESRREDREYLLDLIERARDDAWNDIARVLEENLARSGFVVDDDYEHEREGRMQQLIVEDLAELARASVEGAP